MGLSLQTMAKVDDIVARTQADSRAPSLIAAVVRDGTIAHVSGAGTVPVPDRDIQYRIGSVTKSLTAAVVLALRDEGRLDLDDRLEEHLPATGVGAVRLRALLGHAAGLQREPDGPWWERHAGRSLSDLLARTGEDKLAFGAYARFHYSNLAYGLLGGVVEAAGRQGWWDAVRARVLEPHGMARTTYQAAEPFARGYVVHPIERTLREEPRHDAGSMAPAGQLWSTVDDLCQWAATLAGASAVVDEMAIPVVIADAEAWTQGYGLGLQLWRRGERIYIGHTGSMPGYLAVVAAHRASHSAVVAFANTYSLPGTGIGNLGLSILDVVLDTEPEPAPVPWRPSDPPPPEIEPLCGRWWWMGREYEATWDAGPEELLVRVTGMAGAPSRFTRAGDDAWRGLSGEHAGEILRVLRGKDGKVSALDISTYVLRRDLVTDE